MASSAAVIPSTLPAVTAPGAKSSNTDASGSDSFADMLAAVDATALMQGQAMPPADQMTPVPEEGEGDTLIETAEIPATALPQAGIAPQPAQPTARNAKGIDKADTKATNDEAPQQPANDNMNAAPILPVPAAPVQVATQPDNKTAPSAIEAAPQTQVQAPQQAANDAEAEDETAPQSLQAGQTTAKGVTPKQAAAKPDKSDFKKALDETKPSAKSDSTPAQAADSSKDAKGADAKLAGPQTADARPAETPAQPASHTNANPQPDAIVPASAAANAAPASAAPAATPLHASAPSAPQHAPNLENLAVNIAAKAQGGAKQFDIRLDPPELGRVEVRLSIDATGKAEAHLTADQPQTLDLLRKDSSSLTQALRDAGLDVNQDGLNFSLRNQQQQAGHEQGHAQGGRAWRGTVPMPGNSETANAAGAYTARGLGLLDIKV